MTFKSLERYSTTLIDENDRLPHCVVRRWLLEPLESRDAIFVKEVPKKHEYTCMKLSITRLYWCEGRRTRNIVGCLYFLWTSYHFVMIAYVATPEISAIYYKALYNEEHYKLGTLINCKYFIVIFKATWIQTDTQAFCFPVNERCFVAELSTAQFFTRTLRIIQFLNASAESCDLIRVHAFLCCFIFQFHKVRKDLVEVGYCT